MLEKDSLYSGKEPLNDVFFLFFPLLIFLKHNVYLRLLSGVHLSLALNSFRRNASPSLATEVFVPFLFLKI